MTDQPLPTTNQQGSQANQELTEIIEDTLPAAESAIIAAEPVMGAPVLKQLWQALLKWVIDTIAKIAGQGAGFVVLDVQKYNTLKADSAALAAIRAAQQSGDPDALNQANAQSDDAAASLTHYVGDVKPK